MSETYVAVVTPDGNRDLKHRGDLKVKLLNNILSNEEEFTARCTMAFGGWDNGIFGGVSPGSHVLVTKVCLSKDSEGNSHYEWFWLGVVPQPFYKPKFSPNPPFIDIFTTSLPDARESFHTTDTPNHTIIKSPIGHKLVLADKVTRNANKVVSQEDYALLRTSNNKQIKLDAGIGPNHDKILISDEHGNKIVIKTGPDEKPGPNSIKVECIGNMHITSHQGEIELTVGKESTKDLSLINRGSGNIHIRSNEGDVTIKAEKEINLQSENVKIKTTANVEVEADGDAKVLAHSNMILESDNDLDLKATQITLTAARIDMKRG